MESSILKGANMDREYLQAKLDQYVDLKQSLQATKTEKLAEIEEKTLEYRLDLNAQLESAVKEYHDKLVADYETETAKDMEKVEHYIEVINIMLAETETPDSAPAETEEETND